MVSPKEDTFDGAVEQDVDEFIESLGLGAKEEYGLDDVEALLIAVIGKKLPKQWIVQRLGLARIPDSFHDPVCEPKFYPNMVRSYIMELHQDRLQFLHERITSQIRSQTLSRTEMHEYHRTTAGGSQEAFELSLDTLIKD